MSGITFIAAKSNLLAGRLLRALQQRHERAGYRSINLATLYTDGAAIDLGSCSIYVSSFSDRQAMIPDLNEAAKVFERLGQLRAGKLILISSAHIYGIGHNRQAMAPESYSAPGANQLRTCDCWKLLESMAPAALDAQIVVLRPATLHPSPALLSRRLQRKLVMTLPGHDPMVQLLHIDDLAEAVHCAVSYPGSGVFNVAPEGAVPLHAAIRMSGKKKVPIPRTLQRAWNRTAALEYLRYASTISNSRTRKEIGFNPQKSSLETLDQARLAHAPDARNSFDEFGMDKNYIQFYGRTLFKFLAKYYWRIEAAGLQNIPEEGRGILAGTHRGFMPFDGVMILHLLTQQTGRAPRFLTHPGLLKFPFLGNFMTKLGGVLASQESAERILNTDQLLAVFPEGIQGAFTHYRNAYQIQSFGRHTFVKLALRNRAPIIPFVIVGSAEIFPILGKINWRFWSRYTEWPCIPLTPTFPLLPVPLPSKWHVLFLPPIHVEKHYPPEAARDLSVVRTISLDVQTRMQSAFNELRERRRSIFRGSILEQDSV